MNIFDKIRHRQAQEFKEGIDKTPYEYSNKPLADCIKGKGSFDLLTAECSEVIGRALLAETNKRETSLNAKIYNNVKRKFKKLSKYDKTFFDVDETYEFATDSYICQYLIATWKHGNELGHAIGLNDKQILKIKNDVKDRLMPQEKTHSPRANSGRSM